MSGEALAETTLIQLDTKGGAGTAHLFDGRQNFAEPLRALCGRKFAAQNLRAFSVEPVCQTCVRIENA